MSLESEWLVEIVFPASFVAWSSFLYKSGIIVLKERLAPHVEADDSKATLEVEIPVYFSPLLPMANPGRPQGSREPSMKTTGWEAGGVG